MTTAIAYREPDAVFAELGKLDHYQIADLLREEGIRGYKTNGLHCPIALLVQKRTNRIIVVGVQVWEEVIRTDQGAGVFAWSILNEGRVPRSVERFIGNFDLGDYRDLLAPGDPYSEDADND
jgi:hypothetical protein